MSFVKKCCPLLLAVALMLTMCIGAWSVSATEPTVDQQIKALLPEYSALLVEDFSGAENDPDAAVWDLNYDAVGCIEGEDPSMAFYAATKGDGDRHDFDIPVTLYTMGGVEQYLMFYLNTGDNTITKGWISLEVNGSWYSPDDDSNGAGAGEGFYYQEDGVWQFKAYGDDNGCYENFKCKGYVLVPLSQFTNGEDVLKADDEITTLSFNNKDVDITTESYFLVDDIAVLAPTEDAMDAVAISKIDLNKGEEVSVYYDFADTDVSRELAIGAKDMTDAANNFPKTPGIYLPLDGKTADCSFSATTAEMNGTLSTKVSVDLGDGPEDVPAGHLMFWVDTCGKSIHKGWISAQFGDDDTWYSPDDFLENTTEVPNTFMIYDPLEGWKVVEYDSNDKGCFLGFNFTGYVAVPLASFGFDLEAESYPDITALKINFKAPDWNGNAADSYVGMHLAVDNISTVLMPNIFIVPAAMAVSGEYPDLTPVEESSPSSSTAGGSSSTAGGSSSTAGGSSSTASEGGADGGDSSTALGDTSVSNTETGATGVTGAASALAVAALAALAVGCIRRKK